MDLRLLHTGLVLFLALYYAFEWCIKNEDKKEMKTYYENIS